jgi:hypothetical protein
MKLQILLFHGLLLGSCLAGINYQTWTISGSELKPGLRKINGCTLKIDTVICFYSQNNMSV